MRIFAGTARGRFVSAPKDFELRPTTDRVRLALFNALGPAVTDCTFLDVFSGSGSVGLEALSRGAKKAVFIDSQKVCIDTVKATAQAFGFDEGTYEAWRADHQRGLNTLAGRGLKFDLIFLDPPYNAGLGIVTLRLLLQLQLLAEHEQSRIILEHAGADPSPQVPGLALYRRYDHGAASLSVYGREGATLAA